METQADIHDEVIMIFYRDQEDTITSRLIRMHRITKSAHDPIELWTDEMDFLTTALTSPSVMIAGYHNPKIDKPTRFIDLHLTEDDEFIRVWDMIEHTQCDESHVMKFFQELCDILTEAEATVVRQKYTKDE